MESHPKIHESHNQPLSTHDVAGPLRTKLGFHESRTTTPTTHLENPAFKTIAKRHHSDTPNPEGQLSAHNSMPDAPISHTNVPLNKF